MSATEIIEEFQRLPNDERERVMEFLKSFQQGHGSGEPKFHYAIDAEFDRAAGEVMNEHADLFRRLAQ